MTPTESTSLEDELLAIEAQFWTGGGEAYARHCDDRCLVVFVGMAALLPREEIARTVQKGRWRDVKLRPRGFVRLSESAATIAYECEAVRNGAPPYHAMVSSGYVRRPDGWRLSTHQQTEVPDHH